MIFFPQWATTCVVMHDASLNISWSFVFFAGKDFINAMVSCKLVSFLWCYREDEFKCAKRCLQVNIWVGFVLFHRYWCWISGSRVWRCSSTCALVYLILLSSSFLVVVEDVFSDVLPALVFSGDVINSSFPELVSAAFLVPNGHCHQHNYTHKHTAFIIFVFLLF